MDDVVRPDPTRKVADPGWSVPAVEVSDVLLIVGVTLATVSVSALASIWWALLVPALACIACGVARARAGG